MGIITNIAIIGMISQDCADKVKAALEKLDGVEKVEVSLETEYADVTLKKPIISAYTFKKVIKDAGYEVDYFNNYEYQE